MTAKEVKQIKDRLLSIEDWIKEHELPMSHANLTENMNFLVDTVREYKDIMSRMRDDLARGQNTLQLVGQFMEKEEQLDKWKEYYEKQIEGPDLNQKEIDKLEKMKAEAETKTDE